MGRHYKRTARPVKAYAGELPKNQNWVVGHEGKYAITEDGIPLRYYGNGRSRELKTTLRHGHPCLRLYAGVEYAPKWLKIADEMAKAFLGCDRYIFIDGNTSNVTLDNIAPIDDCIQPDEAWIEGFEGEYLINAAGEVFSFKRQRRCKLKTCDRTGRVNLTSGRNQRAVNASKLVEQYFSV